MPQPNQQQPNNQQQNTTNINAGPHMQPGIPGSIGMPIRQMYPGNSAMNPNQSQNPRQTVWQGSLEWHEKRTDNQRVVHHVRCSMTSNVDSNSGEPEV